MTTATTELLSVIELENEFIPPIGETEARDVAWEQRLNAEVAWQLARATVDDGLAQWTDRAEEGAMRRLPTMRTIARMNTVLVALRERLYQIQNEAANIAIAELALRQQSNPAASSTRPASAAVADRPPRCPRVAMLRMKTPRSSAWPCMRTRSPRIAPPVKGLVGSTASTPTVAPDARSVAVSRSTSVLLPAPGGPVTPMIVARPVCA